MAQPKTRKVFVENIGGFSQKSLKQLTKAFAPTLESIFEARQKAGDVGGGAKQIKNSLGMFGLLGKAFKNLSDSKK